MSKASDLDRAGDTAIRRRTIGTIVSSLPLLFVVLPAGAVDIKRKDVPLVILGVPVTIAVTGSFETRLEKDALLIQLKANGNLKDVQDKALQIAQKLPLPKDNCAHKGVNAVVDSIDGAAITPEGTTAVVELTGHVTAWGCVDLFGNDAKTKVASDSVTVTVPVELVVVDRKEVRLKLSRPAELKTGHKLSGDAARVLLGDVNAKLSSMLAGMFDAREARASLPDLPGSEVFIEDAQFAAEDQVLIVRASGNGRLSNDAFNRLLEFLAK
jgi:hypothetical protein